MKNIKKDQRSQIGAAKLMRITVACNEKCLFCNIPKEEYPKPYEKNLAEIYLEVDRIKKSKGVGVSLSGGEPTIHSKFFEIVTHMKKVGITPIEIQTNSLRFADMNFSKKAKIAGVDELFASLHSHKKEIHDALTGVDGSWEKCVAGIKNAIKLGIDVTLNPVLTEKSFRYFPEYIRFMHQELPKIKKLSVSVMQPHGRAEKNDFLLPDYHKISPFIEEGIRLADKFGIWVGNPYCGIPLCFGSWDKRLLHNIKYKERIEEIENSQTVSNFSDKLKLSACGRCLLNSYCDGVWKKYFKKYPDFKVNPILTEKTAVELKKKVAEKKSIDFSSAEERRHWVRLIHLCNNRCIFCLDKEMLNGKILSIEEVKDDLLKGRKLGIKRVVLSGGEATIHPDFLLIVRLAKKVGYKHVQIITNGRMFAYEAFLKQTVKAGVDEVTFSLHGHLPEIHDNLTGTKGSFMQALRGLKNALATKGLIVSVDVVINKRNIKYLYEILLFYINLGVYEFDLLQIVPFGRAWDNWSKLWYDHDKYAKVIKNVLSLKQDPRLHIWTNRLPIRYLEGYEQMVQDPQKLLGEIEGRREMFTNFILKDKELNCCGERCKYCFIREVCEDLRKIKTRKKIKSKKIAVCLNEKNANTQLNLFELIIEKKEINFAAFINFYIKYRYFAKKEACKSCLHNAKCQGVAVKRIKENGFSLLKPV
jgi:MoaA/NifB/PqqE/SkfB family radical SAM enzyme